MDLARDDAVVYLHDVYEGPGLGGVPRGTIKKLRIAAYHYGLPNMAGPDKCGSGGPWEVMRILGTVPINEDGSAVFRVPACTPLTLQPLDQEGKAVQLMRSWYTAMPGETVSCVGCLKRPTKALYPVFSRLPDKRPVPSSPGMGRRGALITPERFSRFWMPIACPVTTALARPGPTCARKGTSLTILVASSAVWVGNVCTSR